MGRFTKLEIPGQDRLDESEEAPRDRDYVELGDRCLREGSYEAALRYYSRALAQDNRIEEAWLGQILCLINLGEYKEAVSWADRAAGLFPRSADLLAAKAVAWGRSGNLDKALGFSDSSMKLNEASAFVWWARGDVMIPNNPRTARWCFDKAMELGRDDWRLMFWIGKTYLSIDMPAEAKRFLQRAEQLDGDNPVVWHTLGLTYKALGMNKEASRAFQHVLSVNPGREEARRELEILDHKLPTVKLGRGLWNWIRGTKR